MQKTRRRFEQVPIAVVERMLEQAESLGRSATTIASLRPGNRGERRADRTRHPGNWRFQHHDHNEEKEEPQTPKPRKFDAQAFLDSAGVARTIVEFQKKDTIFSQGDLCKDVMYIQKGSGQALRRLKNRQGGRRSDIEAG